MAFKKKNTSALTVSVFVSLSQALGLFWDSTGADVVSFNASIHAVEKASRWLMALELLRTMRSKEAGRLLVEVGWF